MVSSNSPPAANPTGRSNRSSILASTSSAINPNSTFTSTSTSPPPTQSRLSTNGRARSSSLQKSASAVLRALARAPEDSSSDVDGESNSNITTKSSRASDSKSGGYANGEGDADIEGPDGASHPNGNGDFPSGPVSGLGSMLDANGNSNGIPPVGLSKEAIENGRANREGLRNRRENKQVEKLVGGEKKKEKGWKKSKSWEIPRKLFHSSIGFLVLHLYTNHTDLSKIVKGLSIFLGIVITADVIRLNYLPFEKTYEKVLGILMREAEKTQVNGVVWYLIGVITALHFFPEDIASLSVMILSWCDTSASIFGRLLGAYTPPLPSPPFARRKSLAGFVAALISGSITAYLFWGTGIANRGERIGGLSWDLYPTSTSTALSKIGLGSQEAGGAIFGSQSVGTGWRGFSTGFRTLPSYLPYPSTSSSSSASNLGGYLESIKDLSKDLVSNKAPQIPLALLCLGSGVVAAVAESLELGGVDDNLSLPILSSVGIWGMLWCWGKAASWWVS